MGETELQVLEHLKWSLQALAQPGGVQVALFPPFVCVAEELALDLQNWLLVTRSQNLRVHPDALSAIAAIDQQLVKLSGKSNQDFWTIEALKSDLRWENVRQDARTALSVAGWENTAPPYDRSSYASYRKA